MTKYEEKVIQRVTQQEALPPHVGRLLRLVGIAAYYAIILGVMVFGILLIYFATTTTTSQAAPAPMPKPDRGRHASGPPSPCVMRWGYARYNAVFARGGHYHSSFKDATPDHDPRWEGSWATDGKCLIIHERRADGEVAGAWCEYRIELSAGWHGKLPYGGGDFSLTKNGED